MAQRPNIDLRIVPFDTDWHPGFAGNAHLIESTEYSPVVHLEVRSTGLFLHEDADIRECRRAIDLVLGAALTHRMETRK